MTALVRNRLDALHRWLLEEPIAPEEHSVRRPIRNARVSFLWWVDTRDLLRHERHLRAHQPWEGERALRRTRRRRLAAAGLVLAACAVAVVTLLPGGGSQAARVAPQAAKPSPSVNVDAPTGNILHTLRPAAAPAPRSVPVATHPHARHTHATASAPPASPPPPTTPVKNNTTATTPAPAPTHISTPAPHHVATPPVRHTPAPAPAPHPAPQHRGGGGGSKSVPFNSSG